MADGKRLLKIIGSAKHMLESGPKFERAEGGYRHRGLNLYVNYLDDRVDDDYLRKLFSPFGTILSSKVMCDNYGYPRGFGFVNYSTAEEAESAIAHMNGYIVFSQAIHVSVARQKRDYQKDYNYVENRQQTHFQQFDDNEATYSHHNQFGNVQENYKITPPDHDDDGDDDDGDDDDGDDDDEPHGHQNTYGTSSRLASLLNQKTFSDVQFSVGVDVFYAHKLVLALSSEFFASMFYGENALTELKSIVVSEVTSRGFSNMLQYMYTDYVEFHDIQDARETLKASQKYHVSDLETECREYLFGSGEITADNVCFIFENADISNIRNVVEKCQEIFQTETEDVLKSSHFLSSDLATVEAILKNEALTIDSEVDLIKAVFAWGREECKRKNVFPDSVNVRACVGPLLKHIRFLSLPSNVFLKVVEKTELLTTTEACMITLQLSQPQLSIDLPPSLCHKTNERALPAASKLSFCYFKFPLVETEWLFSAGYKADIMSTMQFTVQEGQIKIRGVILQVKKQRFQADVLDVSVDVHSDLEEYSFQKKIEVCDEPITVMLKSALHLWRKRSASLYITVKDLLVSRCYSCTESVLSIEKTDTKLKVVLSGNRTNADDSFLFPVSLLLYEKCKL